MRRDLIFFVWSQWAIVDTRGSIVGFCTTAAFKMVAVVPPNELVSRSRDCDGGRTRILEPSVCDLNQF